MRISKILAMAAAASLVSTPVMAQSVASSTPTSDVRVGAKAKGASNLQDEGTGSGSGVLIGVAAAVAIGVGIYFAVDGDDDDLPNSP